MPGAIIAIDQARPGPSTSFGVPGVARNDLWENRVVTLRSTQGGNSSYSWIMLAKPPGSVATLSGETTATATFTPDLPGSYRVQLITNGGGTGNVQVLIAAIRYDNVGTLVNRGWRDPAFGEVPAEDNFSGQTRGWAEAMEYIFADIVATSVFSAAGDLSGNGFSQTVVGIQGVPVVATAPNPGDVMTYGGAHWGPAASAVTGITQLTGDVLSGPGTGSQAATVTKINGTTVDAGGGLLTGQVLRATGLAAALWGALDLASVNAVTGVLPAANQAAQAMGGDVTGTTAASVVAKATGLAGVFQVLAGTALSLTMAGTALAPTDTTLFKLNTPDPAVASFNALVESSVFNTTRDYRFHIGYNAKAALATEPSLYIGLEQNYEETPGVHHFEWYLQYQSSISGGLGLSSRPIFFVVDRDTGASYGRISAGSMAIGNAAETHVWANFSQAQHTLGELTTPFQINATGITLTGGSNHSFVSSGGYINLAALTYLYLDSDTETRFRNAGFTKMSITSSLISTTVPLQVASTADGTIAGAGLSITRSAAQRILLGPYDANYDALWFGGGSSAVAGSFAILGGPTATYFNSPLTLGYAIAGAVFLTVNSATAPQWLYAAACTSVTSTQSDTAVLNAAGASHTYRAQNTTNGTALGGDLVLQSGSGVVASVIDQASAGGVRFKFGTAELAGIEGAFGIGTFGGTSATGGTNYKASLGPHPGAPTLFGCLWILPPATVRSGSNAIMVVSSSNTNFNTPIAGGNINFTDAGATYISQMTRPSGWAWDAGALASFTQTATAVLNTAGAASTLSAQNTTNGTAVGGNLVLQSGTGVTASVVTQSQAGKISFKVGAIEGARIDPSFGHGVFGGNVGLNAYAIMAGPLTSSETAYAAIWALPQTTARTGSNWIFAGGLADTYFNAQSGGGALYFGNPTGTYRMQLTTGILNLGVAYTSPQYIFDLSTTAAIHFGGAGATVSANIVYDTGTGAGRVFSITGQAAAAASGLAGGNLVLSSGLGDGAGAAGSFYLKHGADTFLSMVGAAVTLGSFTSTVNGMDIASGTGPMYLSAGTIGYFTSGGGSLVATDTNAAAASRVWSTVCTSVTLKQADLATTPSTFTIQAGNVTTGTGSNLVLSSGTGSVAAGNVLFQTGGTTVAKVTPTTAGHGLLTVGGQGTDMQVVIGPYGGYESTYSAIYFLTNATAPASANYGFLGDGTNTRLNVPASGGLLKLEYLSSNPMMVLDFAGNATTHYLSALTWDAAAVAPKISQATHNTVQQTFTIQAANTTTGTGSDLVLTSGTGSVSAGNVIVQTGGVASATFSPTSAILRGSAQGSLAGGNATLTLNSGGTASIASVSMMWFANTSGASTNALAFNLNDTGATNITFSTGTTPSIVQALHATVAHTFTIQAANVTTGTGSDLSLKSGTGTNITVAGTVRIFTGPTELGTFAPSVIDIGNAFGGTVRLKSAATSYYIQGPTNLDLSIANGGLWTWLVGNVAWMTLTPVSSGASSMTVASTVTSFVLSFADTTAAAAAAMGFQAQNSSHVTGVGGNMVLASGTGASGDGALYLKTGSTARATFTGLLTYLDGTLVRFRDASSGNVIDIVPAAAASITFDAASTSVGITQNTHATAGRTFTIQAANVTTGTGSDLALLSGTGTAAANAGNVLLKPGGTTVMQIGATSVQVAQPQIGLGTAWGAVDGLLTKTIGTGTTTLTSTEYCYKFAKITLTAAATCRWPAASDAQGYTRFIWNVNASGFPLTVQDSTGTAAAATLAAQNGAWFLFTQTSVKQITAAFVVA